MVILADLGNSLQLMVVMVTLSANGSFLSLCCTLISVETVSVCGNFYILYYCARVQGFFFLPTRAFFKIVGAPVFVCPAL